MKRVTPYERPSGSHMRAEYRYPRITIPHEISYRYDISSPLEFSFVLMGEHGYFKQPGFSIADTLASANQRGKILEIGGPTETSYELLWAHTLPERPIVANIAVDAWHDCDDEGMECQHSEDDLAVDVITDCRSLPIPNEALGLLMASYLPKLDLSLSNLKTDEYIGLVADVMVTVATGLEKGASLEEFGAYAEVSPRIGFWFEAARTVHDNGLVLYRGIEEEREISLIAALGFELIAHTAYYETGIFDPQSGRHETGLALPEEMLFIKRPSAVADPLPALIGPILNHELDNT